MRPGSLAEVSVSRLGFDEGPVLRALRLRSLADSPYAFGQTLEEAEQRPMRAWHMEARRSAAGDSHAWFVARAGGTDIGTIQGRRRQPDTLLVFSMWVDPQERGSGVGRQLVEAVESWGLDWGATNTLLWVYEKNAAALHFYERLGFSVESLGQDAEAGASYAALAMRRRIRRT